MILLSDSFGINSLDFKPVAGFQDEVANTGRHAYILSDSKKGN
jgi:hypothetical protein